MRFSKANSMQYCWNEETMRCNNAKIPYVYAAYYATYEIVVRQHGIKQGFICYGGVA